MVKVLITGGAGFIGHHLVDYLLTCTDWYLTLLDRLDTSGNLNRLTDLASFRRHRVDRVRFIWHDLRAALNDQLCAQIGEQDYVLHLAAATHVDRSIADPLAFVYENVVGTCNLLNHVRRTGCGRMLYFSTDEVFGPAPEGMAYREWDRYRSGNPYAATKAGAEELCQAFHNSYGLPVFVTHTMNVIGERQHPEKMVPSTTKKVAAGECVTIHADAARKRAGARFYIHARSVAEAVVFLLDRGEPGDKYNIVGAREIDNLSLAKTIAEIVGKPLHYEMVDFHSSRPGHDLRYALDGAKLAEMGWAPSADFGRHLEQTVRWTLEHREWLL